MAQPKMPKDVVMRATEELIPYARNSRTHSKEQIKKLRSSIREFGFTNPILIDSQNNIIAGHGRLMAANEEGIEEVPCLIIDYMTEAQKKAYVIADNRLAEDAGWDKDLLKLEMLDLKDAFAFDLSLTGFEPIEIDKMFATKDKAEEDEFDPDKYLAAGIKPVSEVGDIWILGRHRLMCGDSTDERMVRELLNGKMADMAFTDPPYGVEYEGGFNYNSGEKSKDEREMIKNDDMDLYEDTFAMLSKYVNGPCYVWYADKMAASVYSAADKYGETHASIIWVKKGGYSALSANYKPKHEPCVYWKPKGKTLNFVGATTETTIWEIDKEGQNKLHPTQKPVALSHKAIKNHSAGLVLDLYGGSGSTLIAAEMLNRMCYMMELDPKFADVIVRRYISFVNTSHEVKLIRGGVEIEFSFEENVKLVSKE